MGKKQHQKDKLYLTTKEWKDEWGGYKGAPDNGEGARFRRLPFSCCSLSLQPFETPLCTVEGVIFDLMNIVPFLKKYGVNPATGKKMSAKDLIRLNLHKNQNDEYHCPVTFKVFNMNTHIVAVRVTGNVYCYDAVERLNFKTNNYRDLLSDEPFARMDVITIQDPTNLDKFNIQAFYYVQKKLKFGDDDDSWKKDKFFNLRLINNEAKSTLEELQHEYKPSPYLGHREEQPQKTDIFNAASYSTGRVAASFTSTAMDPETEHRAAAVDEDVLRYERVKKKGYVRMNTSKGSLNIELHCEMVPKTCENFTTLCCRGYYDNTVFHRSIRNFIVQGGDPTGTGSGGESAWGEVFKDEFKPNLVHAGRGVLSMANSGPNTNKSQFFFTYRSARHLDGKHAVFGRLVGGLDTLQAIENVTVDNKDKPKEEIKILTCTVFVNPFDEATEQLAKEREAEIERRRAEEESTKRKTRTNSSGVQPMVYKEGIGKYINSSTIRKRTPVEPTADLVESGKKRKPSNDCYLLSDFSSW